MKKIFTLISMAMLTLSANAANVVGDYKVWTFSDETTGEAVTGIIERDVLYIRGNGSHSVDFINLKSSGTFSDGRAFVWQPATSLPLLPRQWPTVLAPMPTTARWPSPPACPEPSSLPSVLR